MTQYWSTLINALAQDNMNELVLDNQKIPWQYWAEISKYLGKSLNLKSINIHKCQINSIHMDFIWQLVHNLLYNRSVTCLKLSYMPIKNNISTISQLLRENNTLQSLELRNAEIDDTAFGMLLSGLTQNKSSQLVKLDLSCNKITGEVLANSIENYSFGTVADLNLSNNNFSKFGLEDLSSILGHSKNIQHLKLNYCIGDYAEDWGEQTLQGWLDLIFRNNKMLKSISLDQNELGDKKMNIVLKSLLKNSIKLKSLSIANNNLTAEVLPALAEFVRNTPSLTILDLSDNDIANTPSKSDFDIDFSWAHQLNEIDLYYNPISIRHMEGVADFIANSNARRISLSRVFYENNNKTVLATLKRQNNINRLAEALSKCRASILHLDTLEDFDVNAWDSILGKLSSNKHINYLMLNDNNKIADVPTLHWHNFAQNGALEELDLSGNDFSDDAFKELCLAFSNSSTLIKMTLVIKYNDEKFTHIANLIKNNSKITELVLFGDGDYESQITDKSMRLLAEAIEKNNTLRYLHMLPISITQQIISLLVDKISKNQSLTKIIIDYFLSDDKPTKQHKLFYKKLIEKTIVQLNEYTKLTPISMLKVAHLLQRLESSLLSYGSHNKQDDWLFFKESYLHLCIRLRQAFFQLYGYYTQLPQYVDINLVDVARLENIQLLTKMLNDYDEFVNSDVGAIEHYENTLQNSGRVYEHAKYILLFLFDNQPIKFEDANKLDAVLLLYEGDNYHIDFYCSIIKQHINLSKDKAQIVSNIIDRYNIISQLLENTHCQPLRQIKACIDEVHCEISRKRQWQQQIEDNRARAEPTAKRHHAA